MLVGLAVLIVALVIRAVSGEVSAATKTLAITGFALGFGGLLLSALVGLLIRRRAHQGFGGALSQEFETIPPDIPAARAIMSSWFGAASLPPGYPSRVIASLRIPARGRDTSLLVNVPKLTLSQKDRRSIEPASAVAWLELDRPLPALLITPDLRGQSAILGADINIENEEFNRRFRVDSSMPGTAGRKGPAYGDFARYASALLHPRAAACLTRLPPNRTFLITDRLVAVNGAPLPNRDELVLCADVLAEFGDLIPQHVLNRWGGSTDYRPRED
ncbi:hypothetical protein GCM10027298_10770 [Epidermidibacterium keratini]